jgi:dTDP-glucose 4,6-dehydratase/UDP-glucose 4-epimerase
VANGEEVSIERAVREFGALVNPHKSVAFSGTEKAGDPINWCADIQTILEMGYQRKVTFTEGLAQYIAWVSQ